MTAKEANKANNKDISKYPDVLTVPQVQQILSTGSYSVYKLIHEKKICAVSVGKGYRITKNSIEKYLNGGVA